MRCPRAAIEGKGHLDRQLYPGSDGVESLGPVRLLVRFHDVVLAVLIQQKKSKPPSISCRISPRANASSELLPGKGAFLHPIAPCIVIEACGADRQGQDQ